MFTQQRVRKLTTLVTALFLGLSPTVFGQDKSKKAPPEGTPILWRDPGDISSLDLFNGPGGAEMKPDLSNVTYIEKQTGGHSVKYRVRDGSGKIWIAKIGSEAQPETASVRLVWAMGYMPEITYLAPCAHIKGVPAPSTKQRCEGDGFENVRFEARPANMKRLTEWGWSNNTFANTKEMKGLIVVMGLLNNWDLKDVNNRIVQVKDGAGGKPELRYVISDLGATFGKTGGFITHNRNSPKDYAKSRFVDKVMGNTVKFAYNGKNKGLFDNITVEQARWIGEMLSRLTDQQISDAFRAANYGPEDNQLLTSAVRKRINELVNLPK